MLLKIKTDRTIHPDFFVSGNDLQTEKGGGNMAKKNLKFKLNEKLESIYLFPLSILSVQA